MASAIWDEKRGRWKLRICENGKVRFYSSRTPGRKGKKEVEDKAAAGDRLTGSVRFCDAWARYLEEVEHMTGPENYTNTESIGRLYLLPKLGAYRLPSLTLNDFQEILWKVKKKNGEPLAKKSLSNIRGVMVNFNKYCIRSGIMTISLSELRLPKSAKKIGKEILQPDQARRLFSDFEDDWYIHLWRFLLATGCRPGEALGLTWSDIHDGCITIQRAVNYRGRMTEGKNENAKRTFALNSILDKILQDQKEKTWRLNSEFVFCNHAGKHALQTATKNSWEQIRKELGTKASPYALRHTFVSFMAQTLPEQALKDLIGHSVNMDTYGVYKHVVNGQKERAAEQVNITLLNTIK